MGTVFRPVELNDLNETLSPEQRDELLQCLLVAAPRGGMTRVLEETLLCHAAEELLEEHGPPVPVTTQASHLHFVTPSGRSRPLAEANGG